MPQLVTFLQKSVGECCGEHGLRCASRNQISWQGCGDGLRSPNVQDPDLNMERPQEQSRNISHFMQRNWDDLKYQCVRNHDVLETANR